MKKKHFVLVLILLFVINIGALATLSYNRWLRPQSWDMQQDTVDAGRDLRNEMRLTPRQMERIQGRRVSFDNEIESLQNKMWETKISLVQETKRPSPDLDRIDALIEEFSRLQASAQKKTMRNLLKDKELLTPQQRERYFSLFEDHMRRQGRGHRGRGRGRGGPRWRRESQKDERIKR
ncbi:Spy/CpxP family protein refolding chaperone [Acidobacteriota bacterium]